MDRKPRVTHTAPARNLDTPPINPTATPMCGTCGRELVRFPPRQGETVGPLACRIRHFRVERMDKTEK